MSATTAQRRVELPESVLRCLEAIAGDDTLAPADRITATVMVIYGYAWYDEQEKIDPTRLAIPTAQWRRICAALAHNPDGVNAGLDFMNVGPSAYD